MRAPTISEVAKTAGVSVATVSRVVNGSPSVSHETQARVQEAIERLGYQPNVWGRSLRRGESRVVLVIVPNVSNPYYAPIIAGTEDRLHEDGYSGMLCITNAEAERRALYLEFLKDGRADGAILMEPARDDPHVTGMARHYHLVQCSEYCDNQAVSHVSVDNLAAAREVVLTLAGLGHRRIGFIGADNDFMSTIARRQGYLDGLRVLNIPAGGRPDLCRTGLQLCLRREAARRLLARPERPTALVCISDVRALGAVQAARELGLRGPEDLSVVGIDDVEYAVMGHPRLTTVRQPCYELGRTAGELLLTQIQGGPRGRAVYLPHTLIERDSTARCAVGS
ncbi:MAG: LacI family DNA-binding transcriptional regulator [Flavonifractor plautii]